MITQRGDFRYLHLILYCFASLATTLYFLPWYLHHLPSFFLPLFEITPDISANEVAVDALYLGVETSPDGLVKPSWRLKGSLANVEIIGGNILVDRTTDGTAIDLNTHPKSNSVVY